MLLMRSFLLTPRLWADCGQPRHRARSYLALVRMALLDTPLYRHHPRYRAPHRHPNDSPSRSAIAPTHCPASTWIESPHDLHRPTGHSTIIIFFLH